MNRDLSDYRKVYEKDFLIEAHLPEEPMILFDKWFKEADAIDSMEANAMTLSTLSDDGFIKGRVVLLKSYGKDGFTFFTNYNSDKGKAIAQHNKVGLSFFWPSLERQVVIDGVATMVDTAASDAYFATRPRESQLGAHASNQSDVISGRNVLQDKLNDLEKQFQDKTIPRPDHWGGYLIAPHAIEFWQGRPSRLHDRIRFVKSEDGTSWESQRLAP